MGGNVSIVQYNKTHTEFGHKAYVVLFKLRLTLAGAQEYLIGCAIPS